MDTERWVKSIIRGLMCLVGIIGNNWLCFSSLPSSISQLRTADVLFVNLAVSNLITNYLVDTLHILKLTESLPEGSVLCEIQAFLPEFSETSSILSTLFITVYWYQKLVGSLKRGGAPVQMDNLRLIAVLLIASWTFSIVLNCVYFTFGAEDRDNTTTAKCIEELPSQAANQAYDVAYVILANVIPLSCILYASIQIIITLLQNEQRMKKMTAAVRNGGSAAAEKNKDDAKNVSTNAKSQDKSGSLVRAAKSVVAVAIFFLICWAIHLTAKILMSFILSSVIEDVESFVGATYTCIIPYIYLYGVQKLTCSRQ